MAQDVHGIDSNESSYMDDSEGDSADSTTSALASYVTNLYSKAEDARYTDENSWIKAYKNYRGTYSADVQFLETEKSRVFIKVTKTKVLAAYSQIVDVLLANNEFPLTINPTTLPEGVAESVHFDPAVPEDLDLPEAALDLVGYDGDGTILPPGSTMDSLLADRLGPLGEVLEDVPVTEGPGVTQTAITYHPAEIAAKMMEKQIKDQLEESKGSTHLRHSAFECALFGTGVIKGPFATTKE